MRAAFGAIFVGLVAASAVAAADLKGFTAYEGVDAVRPAGGGTRVTANGVDFWTSGTPGKAYRILGVLTDKRPDSGFGSNPTKSKALAARIKAAGGDAAVVAGSGAKLSGVVALGSGLTVPVSDKVTTFLVVKYESQ